MDRKAAIARLGLWKGPPVVSLTHSTNDPREVYIGRAGHGHDGYFGNPCKKGATCPECGQVHLTPGSTLPCYARYLDRRIQDDPEFRRRVEGLHDRILVCFCAVERGALCHGRILAAKCEDLRSGMGPMW